MRKSKKLKSKHTDNKAHRSSRSKEQKQLRVSENDLLRLQREVGNQAVLRILSNRDIHSEKVFSHSSNKLLKTKASGSESRTSHGFDTIQKAEDSSDLKERIAEAALKARATTLEESLDLIETLGSGFKSGLAEFELTIELVEAEFQSGVYSLTNVELLDAARFRASKLYDIERTLGVRGRSAIAESLILIYNVLEYRIADAPTDEKGLPKVAGIEWSSKDPQAGLLHTIPPFEAIDIWYGMLIPKHRSRTREKKKKAKAKSVKEEPKATKPGPVFGATGKPAPGSLDELVAFGDKRAKEEKTEKASKAIKDITEAHWGAVLPSYINNWIVPRMKDKYEDSDINKATICLLENTAKGGAFDDRYIDAKKAKEYADGAIPSPWSHYRSFAIALMKAKPELLDNFIIQSIESINEIKSGINRVQKGCMDHYGGKSTISNRWFDMKDEMVDLKEKDNGNSVYACLEGLYTRW